jgi:hypothetical protein
MTKYIASLLFALVLGVGVPVGAVAGETPEQVADAYLDAIRTEGFAVVPDYIHPDERERFRGMLLPVLLGDGPAAEPLRKAFFGEKATPASVQAMDAKAFMQGFMGFAQNQMATLDVSIGRSEMLGSVREGDVVHLVTRSTAGAGALQLTQMEVISLKPYEDTWRLMLSGKMEGMAQALSARAAAGSSKPNDKQKD